MEQEYKENQILIDNMRKEKRSLREERQVTYSNSNYQRTDPWGAELARRRNEIRNQKNENARLKRELNLLLKAQENVKLEKIQNHNEILKQQNRDSTLKIKEMQRQVNQLKDIMKETMRVLEQQEQWDGWNIRK